MCHGKAPARRRWNCSRLSTVDGILLDLVMPGLSGQRRASASNSEPNGATSPHHAHGARRSGCDDRSINAGADDYIAKSADFDVLKAACALSSAANTSRMRTAVSARSSFEGDRSHRAQAGGSGTEKLDQRLRDQQFYTRSLIESNIDALMTTDPLGIIPTSTSRWRRSPVARAMSLIGAPSKNYFTDLGAGRSGHQAGAERKKSHRTTNSPRAPGMARKRRCPTTPHLLRPG